nr:hypothetical protein [Escherichia coli]
MYIRGSDYAAAIAVILGGFTVAIAYVRLLYTSDAADELDGVDLGGRRLPNKTICIFSTAFAAPRI